ncbi:hypothetical protein CSW14_10500 [Thermus scotoductus]|jgi:hypothetical protein|uniref:Uncharacterized protein n=1 Tax=Thermus scotoductus TaxID=37636 RepID=A0A430VFY3_THESC|nr:hypothetical protein [Thermus scotoductus]RTI49986.1 hypothetical protein CSW14_10500 [Thermus scotoductus]
MKDRELLYLVLGLGGGVAAYLAYQAWKKNQVVTIPIQHGGGGAASPQSPPQPAQPVTPQPAWPGLPPAYPVQPGPVMGWYQQNQPQIQQGLSGIDQIISGINAIGNLFGQIGGLFGGGSTAPAPDASLGTTDYYWDPLSQSYTTTPPELSQWGSWLGDNASSSGYGYDSTAPVGSYAGWL